MDRHWFRFLLVGLAAALALASPSFAQVRGQVTVSNPGAMRGVGGSGAVSNFLSSSYGIGSLQSPSGGPSTNVLRSSVESKANYTISYRGAGEGVSPVSGALPEAARSGSRLYTPIGSAGMLKDQGGGGLARSSGGMTAAANYLSAIGGYSGDDAQAKAITSMISPIGGGDKFSAYMSEGEKAFRDGDFEAALDRFRMANLLSTKNPESLLSMAQASFAMSRNSYFRASFYLTRAIKYLPELPLTPLDPKGFFGSQEQYSACLRRLEKYTAAISSDSDAMLVLAYYRWFDKDVAGARATLSQARRQANKGELVEAIDTFWDGMKASGKVTGSLLSAETAPATGASSTPALGGGPTTAQAKK